MPVYDLSYRRGRGAERRGPRWLPIFIDCLTHALRNRWMKVNFLLCCLPALFAIGVIYTVRNVLERIGGGASLRLIRFDLTMYDNFFRWTWFPVVLLATGAGAGLISEDRRSNALEVYFSRAIYRGDYLLGKVLGMTTVLFAGTALPFVIAWFFDCGLTTDVTRFATTWDYPLRLMAYGLAFALPTSLMVLAISSCARGSMWASVYWIAVAFFSWLLGQFAARGALKDFRGGLLSFIDTYNALRFWILDIPVPGHLSPVTPPYRLAAIAIVFLALLSMLVLVRRTQPTEVVS